VGAKEDKEAAKKKGGKKDRGRIGQVKEFAP